MYKFRGYYIPERMRFGIERYINYGIPPGGFLKAVITNNLSEAIARADDENLANLPAFVAYFYNEAPSMCWGSVENYRKWKGLNNMNKEVSNDEIQRQSQHTHEEETSA